MRLQLFPLMFAPLDVNSPIEINRTHLVADAIAVADGNADAQCERALSANLSQVEIFHVLMILFDLQA